MKRFFAIFLLISVLFLCGCAKKQDDVLEFRKFPLSASGNLCYRDSAYGITLNMSAPGKANITVDSPNSLSGYSFKVDNGGIWVYYDSMEIDISLCPDTMPVEMLVDMLSPDIRHYSYSRRENGMRLDFFETDNAEIIMYLRDGEEFPYLMEYFGDEKISFETENFASGK